MARRADTVYMPNLWKVPDMLWINPATAPEEVLAKTTRYTTEFKRVRLESLLVTGTTYLHCSSSWSWSRIITPPTGSAAMSGLYALRRTRVVPWYFGRCLEALKAAASLVKDRLYVRYCIVFQLYFKTLPLRPALEGICTNKTLNRTHHP